MVSVRVRNLATMPMEVQDGMQIVQGFTELPGRNGDVDTPNSKHLYSVRLGCHHAGSEDLWHHQLISDP